MKNYNIINAIKNVFTNARGGYYSLMAAGLVLSYVSFYIAQLQDPERTLLSGLVGVLLAMLKEGEDYYKDIK